MRNEKKREIMNDQQPAANSGPSSSNWMNTESLKKALKNGQSLTVVRIKLFACNFWMKENVT